jgi:hypothetical protein
LLLQLEQMASAWQLNFRGKPAFDNFTKHRTHARYSHSTLVTRPKLKLVLMSATLHAGLFQEYFSEFNCGW